MRIFLRLHLVGCVLFFVVSCQTKVASIPPDGNLKMFSLPDLFSKLESHQLGIRDLKAIVRTKIAGRRLNQTFRQALLVKDNESIRLETYNLFRQVLSVLVYDGKKALMYDPGRNRIIRGEEVWLIMRRIMGDAFSFKEYISILSGGIPRFSHLQAKALKWNPDQLVYQVEAIDPEKGENIYVAIDAYTQLPKSVFLMRDDQEIYRIYWDDYRKVDRWDFAHKIVIDFILKNEVITLTYSDVFINQGFPSDAFELVSDW